MDDDIPDGVPADPDSPAGQRRKMELDMHHMRNSQDLIREHVRMQAQISRHAFTCLLEEGFTEQQALDLIKARGAML